MAYPKRDDKAKRPMKGVKVDDDLLIQALIKYNGNVSRASDSVGITRTTFYDHLKACPELQKTHQDCRQRWIDELEDSAWDQASNSSDTQLKIFLLKTQAKDRGYMVEDTTKDTADIAKAAFEFVINKSKNPAES